MQKAIKYMMKKDPEFCKNPDDWPSWPKVGADPAKASAFLTALVRMLFLGAHNNTLLHLRYQLNRQKRRRFKLGHSMMFFSPITSTENLDELADIIQAALGTTFLVRAIHGDNSDNSKSEADVRQWVKLANRDNKELLLITGSLCQRSFSVPEIENVFLCCDRGSVATNLQRMGRSFTPDSQNPEKIARIFVLSFDPERNDSINDMIEDTAYRGAKRTGNSLEDEIRLVFKTISFFDFDDEGRLAWDVDEYMRGFLGRSGAERIVASGNVVNLLTPAVYTALANYNGGKRPKQDVAPYGRTYVASDKSRKSSKPKTSNREKAKMDAKVRETIRLIIRVALPLLSEFGKFGDSWKTRREIINKSDPANKKFLNSSHGFGMPWQIVVRCLEQLSADLDKKIFIDAEMRRYPDA